MSRQVESLIYNFNHAQNFLENRLLYTKTYEDVCVVNTIGFLQEMEFLFPEVVGIKWSGGLVFDPEAYKLVNSDDDYNSDDE